MEVQQLREITQSVIALSIVLGTLGAVVFVPTLAADVRSMLGSLAGIVIGHYFGRSLNGVKNGVATVVNGKASK